MNRIAKYISAGCFIFFITITIAIAQSGSIPILGESLVKKEFSLLNARLTVGLPEESKNPEASGSIMEASESPEKETRFVYESSKERMVITAMEGFWYATPDIEKRLKTMVSSWTNDVTYTLTPVQCSGNISAYLLVPSSLQTENNAIHTGSAFIINNDSTVQLINFFINQEAAKRPAYYRQLMEEIITTAKPGERKLQLAAQDIRISYGNKTLIVPKPEKYIYLFQEGPDFDLHYFFRMTAVGEDNAKLSLYLGNNPDYMYNQYGIEAKAIKLTDGNFLKKEIKWKSYETITNSTFPNILEYMLTEKDEVDYTSLHLAIVGWDKKEMENLKKLAEKISKE